ncbi:hypothetical protein GMORB2_4610 [Geosmithia morbida]|uniref:Heat shock factor binding protein 1 n=1 Tax=Geosmithia morbida TaxID=1094350 RepID=A0A9P5D0R1_9HYPO|nr:uncharacterized protein GMORB2_4610 [Geosmithia morbida]KAF4119701.1 hypothetical protein GMORB2_4610 [Geosmithia morbida]
MSDKPDNDLDQDGPEDARPDVAAAVDELLNTLSTKFASISSEMAAKMDEMSKRIDRLEAELTENKAQDGGSTKP